jgi:hypothetical protein
MNKFEPKTFSEMFKEYSERRMEKMRNPVWGEWTFDYKTGCLCFRIDGTDDDYHICLSKINQSSQILDWIFQLNAKTWATPQIMKDLLEAMEFLLNPQANYCSFGINKPCDAKTVIPQKPEGLEQIHPVRIYNNGEEVENEGR